ncbi:2,3-bisphosphoglycerate-independent phosphoglycerate mutase [Patescibacteria group bacterium]
MLDANKTKNTKINSKGVKPVVLLVLDGWGLAPPSQGNALHLANTPNIDKYPLTYPSGQLIASGESVGLPANTVGNSEVGHLTLGAGRVVYQSLTKIDNEIEKRKFFENKALFSAIKHAKDHDSRLHLIGLTGSGYVHSSTEHFYALLELCKRNKFDNYYFHLMTDGRDAPPQDGINVIRKIDEIYPGKIVSLTGRYYGMDRDKRWERTQKAYQAMVSGKGDVVGNPIDAIRKAYEAGKTDEFIEPSVVVKDGKPIATIDDNDACIFFNFRVDRPRQLTMAFTIPDFENLKNFKLDFNPHHDETRPLKKEEEVSGTFKREKIPQNLHFVTMTEYQKKIPVSAVAYPTQTVQMPLPEAISKSGLTQFCLAESEKERMVTYYYRGQRGDPYAGEEYHIEPSPKVKTYDLQPEMSLYKVLEKFKEMVAKDKFNFYFINFANTDMVGHTGILEAGIKAAEHVDICVGEMVENVLSKDGTIIIIADHGNSDEMIKFPATSFFYTSQKGEVSTEHSNNPVPIYILNNSLRGNTRKIPQGSLSDLAPTVMSLLGLPIPKEMTGRNLLE